jgi:predicted DNA-binding protein
MPGEKKSAPKKTSVHLERTQHEHLSVLAKRTGRSKSQLIRKAISEIPDRELLDSFGE